MTTGYTLTTRQIIDAALRKVGVLIQGEAAESVASGEAIIALNAMLKSFFTLGMQYSREYEKVVSPLVQGVSNYPISPDTVAPLGALYNVYQAFLRNTSTLIDLPIRIISMEEYRMLTDKTQQGVPVQIAIDSVGQNVNVYLTPDENTATNNELYLYGYAENVTIEAATDVLVIPEVWYEAVIYGLAVRLAPEYGVSLDVKNDTKTEAAEALARAVDFLQQENSTFFGMSMYGTY